MEYQSCEDSLEKVKEKYREYIRGRAKMYGGTRNLCRLMGVNERYISFAIGKKALFGSLRNAAKNINNYELELLKKKRFE